MYIINTTEHFMLSAITSVECGMSKEVEESMISEEIGWNTVRDAKKNTKNRLVKKK